MSNLYNIFSKSFYWLRTTSLFTFFLKQKYIRSYKYIQIDITYRCNLKCINCDRSCGKAISDESMSIDQIEKFIQESILKIVVWDRIDILGGEPTLHDDFLGILELIIQYKYSYSPLSIVRVVTNGRGNSDILRKLHSDIIIYNSYLQNTTNLFHPFNLAPIDNYFYRYSDFSNGCWITQECGIGLNKYGFYPCAVAASIDRVLGFDKGLKKLPDNSDMMYDLLNYFCRYCGHFMYSNGTDKEQISTFWNRAYNNYLITKPYLDEY